MAIDLGAKKQEVTKPRVNMSKTLTPRNEVCTIIGIGFRLNDYNNQNGIDIQLNLEGVDMTAHGFEGFFIDKEDESLGRHKGAVGNVKLSQYSYADKTFPARNGRPAQTVLRDDMIIADLGKLATVCGKVDELFEGVVENVEMLIAKADTVLKGSVLNLLIAGKEYEANGYTKYELFIAKPDKGFEAMELPGTKPSKVQLFDPAKHIVKKKASAAVEQFETVSEEFSV